MKKNFISKLLMATLVVVTMGVFSSCKDYDDDINATNSALTKGLADQKAALDAATANLQSQITSADAAIKAAQADATSALSQIDQAKKDLENAQKNWEKALADAKANLQNSITAGDEATKAAALAEAQKLADAARDAAITEAQSRIDAAEARILQSARTVAEQEAAKAAAKAKEEMIADVNAKLQKLNDALADRYTKEEIDELFDKVAKNLDEAIQPLAADISQLKSDLVANGQADAALKAKVDEIYNRAIKDGELDQAIALVASQCTAIETNLNKLISDDEAKKNAGFATLTGLNEAWQQININNAAIEALDAYITTFKAEILPTLATKQELQAEVLDLKNLIAEKASKDELQAAVDAIYAALYSKEEVDQKVAAAVQEIKDLLAADYVDNNALNSALTLLSGQITAAYTNYTDEKVAGMESKINGTIDSKLAALQSEINGTIEAKIAANNVVLKNEIYGKVSEMIGSSIDSKLAAYTTTEGLMDILAGYATAGSVTDEINAFYENKLKNKMAEIDNISTKLANMENQLELLAEELGALDDFVIDTEASGRMLVGENASSGIDALVALLKTMSAKIENIHAYVDQVLVGVDEKLNNFSLFTIKDLTSLVYRPESDRGYLYGFPVISATLLDPKTTKEIKLTYNAATDQVTKTLGGAVTKQFDITAKYWLNPSCADWTKYTFDFDEVPAKNQITRANGPKKAGVHVNNSKPISVKDGIATFAVTVDNADELNDALTDGDFYSGPNTDTYAWITTVALQATRNDANVASKDTITSDYAIIVPSFFKDLLLARDDFQVGAAHEQGNQKNHLNTEYETVKSENASALYSYELAYNDEKALVDLTKICVHYDDGKADHGYLTHQNAILNGYEFKYTILTNANAFSLNVEKDENGDETKATITVKDHVNTNVGKVANVLVELQPKGTGKTVAYGYISIIITSPKVELTINMLDLVIKCPAPVVTSLKWTDVKNAIESAIGVTGALANYTWDGAVTDLTKYTSSTATTVDNKKGIIAIDETGNTFSWSFTEAEIEQVFYTLLMVPNAHEYTTWLHLTPNAGHPELSEVVIKVVISNEVYPTGEFSYTQRIQQYWFSKESTKIAESAETRYEIHGNVEVVGQPAANDEFFFNIAASFFNSKYDQPGYNDPNAILIYSTHGLGYEDLATVYFDAEKYYIYNAADAGKTIAQMKSVAPATSFATGMSGAEYLLYIADRDATVLMAVKDKLDTSKAQPVVVLSETYNNVATYQGWTYFDGTNKDDFAFAYDLLNKNDHNEVAAGETFTTHMMLDKRDYCFPIDFSTNESFKFDIRWLRPISVDEQEDHVITDAVDYGTVIRLAEHASFIDWRDIKFSAKQRINYINYYGIRAIKPNLDKAVTDINGGWTNIKYFPLLQFEDNTTEGSGSYADGADFIKQLGYVMYTNNGLNVGDFKIKMPITLLYDWGETAEQWITFTIKKTTGQEITARQN